MTSRIHFLHELLILAQYGSRSCRCWGCCRSICGQRWLPRWRRRGAGRPIGRRLPGLRRGRAIPRWRHIPIRGRSTIARRRRPIRRHASVRRRCRVWRGRPVAVRRWRSIRWWSTVAGLRRRHAAVPVGRWSAHRRCAWERRHRRRSRGSRRSRRDGPLLSGNTHRDLALAHLHAIQRPDGGLRLRPRS